ncbi:hypothetical protein ACP4OV_023554 [Aristida adscensionis]
MVVGGGAANALLRGGGAHGGEHDEAPAAAAARTDSSAARRPAAAAQDGGPRRRVAARAARGGVLRAACCEVPRGGNGAQGGRSEAERCKGRVGAAAAQDEGPMHRVAASAPGRGALPGAAARTEAPLAIARKPSVPANFVRPAVFVVPVLYGIALFHRLSAMT